MASAQHWEGRRRQWIVDKKVKAYQDELMQRKQSNPSDQPMISKAAQLEISTGDQTPGYKPFRRYTSTDYNQQW